MVNRSASQQTYFGSLALVYAASALATVEMCRSMSHMGGMQMPGDWSMSIAWMLAPNQTWLSAEASFIGMWDAMVVAMMMPSLVPMLGRYRATVEGSGMRQLGPLTSLVGGGYMFVWTLIGVCVFPFGYAISAVEMHYTEISRVVPLAIGVMGTTIGVLQLTPWKACRLDCCNKIPCSDHVLPATAATAWRHGTSLGVRCALCCSGLMALQIVLGVMDLRLMVLVTAAITAERLAPNGTHVARLLGSVIIIAGMYLTARALGFQL